MKKYYLLLLICISFQLTHAQPTKAEMEKMMKDAKEQLKKYASDSTLGNVMKNLQNQQQQVSDAMNNKGSAGYSNTTLDPGDYSNAEHWKFPKKNITLLSALPKKIFTRPELLYFLNDLYSQLAKKFPTGIRSSVNAIATKYANNGDKMGDEAVAGWYKNFKEEGLLLSIKAAIANPDNGILLNNCAALLNMSGIEQKAIPLLKYVLQWYPKNAMLLNNIGQAYAGLGATDTAMVYFAKCIKAAPNHPEACNTVAQIEAEKGNTKKASEDFKKSIKSAYSKTAAIKFKMIDKDAKIAPLIRPRVKLPEYFNEFKYELPLQCTSVDNAVIADADHKAFREIISDQLKQFGSRAAELMQRNYQKMMGGPKGGVVNKDEFMAHPFYELCGTMYNETYSEYLKAMADLGVADKKYYAALSSLENEYQTKLAAINKAFKEREKPECCGDGNTSCCVSDEEKCKAHNYLANAYLPKFANLTVEWQKKNKLVFSTYMDEVLYWGYLSVHPSGDDNFRQQVFYPMVTQYLTMLGKIANTKIIEPCEFTPVEKKMESHILKDFECPVDVDISIVVAALTINCEKISFSGGEGALFKFEKNIKTKKSTLSVGIGLRLPPMKKELGPIEVSAGAGITETLFITFDGNNKIEDYGVEMKAYAAAGIKASHGVKNVEVSKEFEKEVSVGCKFGVNSGVNFDEGPFKGMVGPEQPVQLNKSVNIFKENN